jgi:hypothetical protein
VQIAAVPAAWLMARAVFRSLALPAAASSALLFAFLFSRRTHSAVTATFYIECLEPVLILWMIWAWLRGRPRQYWVALLLALGCKEDMALYVAAFGLVLIAQKAHRRLGLATAAVGTLWLALSIWVIVPAVRQAEGLPPTYPFLEDRYHADGQTGTSVGEALGRMASARSLGRVFNLTSTVGFLCIGGPEWLVVLLPGVAANLAARPDTLQSVFVSHYVWPVLPWLFMAGAAGLTRLWRVAPRAGLAASALLALLTIADSPLWITRVPDRAELATARTIRQSLSRIPDDAGVWVAPNLLPHLAQRRVAHTIGSRIDPAQVQILALANFGNLWPLDRDQVDRIARACEQDPHVSKQPAAGPLLVFHLHADAFADPNGCVAAARGTAPD